MTKTSKKDTASLTARPQSANLEAPAPVKAQPNVAAAIDGELLELAAMGGEENLNRVIQRVHGMAVGEILLHMHGALRLQEWLCESLVCRGAGGEVL